MSEPPRPPGEGQPDSSSDPTAPLTPPPGNDPTSGYSPPPAYGSPPPSSGAGGGYAPPPSSGAGGYAPPPSSGAGGYPPPSSGAGGYPTGGGAPPPFGQPSGYGAPGYGAPGYAAPGHGAPGYGLPGAGYPTGEDRTFSLLAHFGGAVGAFISFGPLGFVGPLIVYLMRGQQSPTVRAQAVAALNFQLLWSIIAFVGLFLGWCLLYIPNFIIWAIQVIIGIIAGVKAANGEAYRYPMSANFIK